MRNTICYEIRGRIRLRIDEGPLDARRADIFEHGLAALPGVRRASVDTRTRFAVIEYDCPRRELLAAIRELKESEIEVSESTLAMSGRAVGDEYWGRLVWRVLRWTASRIFLPMPVRGALTVVGAVKYLARGVRALSSGKIEMPVLDAAAIGASLVRGELSTASSVMLLMDVGEILEEWTRKRSIGDLARSMAINVDTVWAVRDGEPEVVSANEIVRGDIVEVRMSGVIPFDGEVVSGTAMVNQASMTGESLPVPKEAGASVFAGTVVEEGSIRVRVAEVGGSGRFDKIVAMIEESERLKSSLESSASHLADRLVPYTLAGAAAAYLVTRDPIKAMSILMVDFSCALKLAMPLSVLSAIRDAGERRITVKGGRFMEAFAAAETIVFDKTGTLTKASPRVSEVITFNGRSCDELLRMAACLEEHFPHSIARSVVSAASERGLDHAEMHSEVEYIVAHGIASRIGGARVVVGSHHFVFDDERCTVPEQSQERFTSLPLHCSHLYLAIDGRLEGVICIDDPLRDEAPEIIRQLRAEGFKNIVMMTGDSERTARHIAELAGVDRFFSEVLPQDKAAFIEQEKAAGRQVVMVGDGINDTPALSAADVGVAISEGAAIAREIADVTISEDSLRGLLALRRLSEALMDRVTHNYRSIVGFNAALILLGLFGLMPPAISALAHNASTVAISLKNMEPLLEKEEKKRS